MPLDFSLIPNPEPSTGLDSFVARQIQANANQDPLRRFRGTLSKVRRQAMLSKDPKQLAAFFHLSSLLGTNPSFSNTGNYEDRMARAEGKLALDSRIAQGYQTSPLDWLYQ